MTDGYTPSDLLALCKAAVLISNRKKMKNGNQFILNITSSSTNSGNNSFSAGDVRSLKPIHLIDFEEAIQSVLPTRWNAQAYSYMNGGQSPIFESDGGGNGPSNRVGSVTREV